MRSDDGTGQVAGGRVVAVAGASGLVGRALLARLCADPGVAQVHALVRRPLAMEAPKLQVHLVDFARMPALPALDEAYLALGTTIRLAGSRAAFRAVDFDASLAVAQAAVAAGARRIGLVSATGADARSHLFYSRVKGELENALLALPLDALVIARPSLLLGDRSALGQPPRRGEGLAAAADRWFRPLVPARVRAIAADDVAAALVSVVPQARGRQLLESERMQGGRVAASDPSHPSH
ncbi:NAD(P)H-binding protein [Luteimonas sp. MC1750]|uniref:NAD(P)H-binding protein n=1 Tax=Luteimonas sp. MC1750 TaxID=2799326 RepID=UPI0018F0DD6F|nr:NAD(P)H-binding protein [Luteimonas sp. MC1750]MBJ6985649.1 NAD(P)H-binding protein [Luteimonas sp. MC1750]QQO06127.1 NAD(P)H-binding protein [Luteimonas sp. MC1750]